jgi:hypothetical protein
MTSVTALFERREFSSNGGVLRQKDPFQRAQRKHFLTRETVKIG